MNRAIASLLAAVVVVPTIAAAQGEAASASAGEAGGSGVVVTVGAGGGGSIGASPDYGIFEAELGVGYELPPGIRPEMAFAIGIAPAAHVALRPGIHVSLGDLPLYLRAALDVSTLGGSLDWRWLLAGGGTELRLTDVLGAFAEADVGVPLRSAVGGAVLARAGLSLRF